MKRSSSALLFNNQRSLHMNLKVSRDEYKKLVERLAHNVYESGYDFNQIICIARGRLRVGDVLPRIYNNTNPE